MGAITAREFAIRQPYFPARSEHEDYYRRIAEGMEDVMVRTDFGKGQSGAMCRHIAFVLAGYFQDVVADAGLWRSFVDANRELYGYSVPFHTLTEDYVDYELNREDIRFLVWYDIAMMDTTLRLLDPHDVKLLEMADMLYAYLEARYDEAPVNEEYNIVRGLSYTDEADQESIMHLARWLFMYSWLLSPAFAMTLQKIAMLPEVQADKDGILLQRRLDEAVTDYPSGPLALYAPEWVYLMINGKLPTTVFPKEEKSQPTHPYYDKFVKATGGREIAYFASYDDLNSFFIHALGWEKGERHLEQMSEEKDFVLMVNPAKGMLLAKNIARNIADPDNPLYDKDYACAHAMDLLTERGVCPADLLKFIYKHNWLPDARFSGSEDVDMVSNNHDFIARCYLQEYYRGD